MSRFHGFNVIVAGAAKHAAAAPDGLVSIDARHIRSPARQRSAPQRWSRPSLLRLGAHGTLPRLLPNWCRRPAAWGSFERATPIGALRRSSRCPQCLAVRPSLAPSRHWCSEHTIDHGLVRRVPQNVAHAWSPQVSAPPSAGVRFALLVRAQHVSLLPQRQPIRSAL